MFRLAVCIVVLFIDCFLQLFKRALLAADNSPHLERVHEVNKVDSQISETITCTMQAPRQKARFRTLDLSMERDGGDLRRAIESRVDVNRSDSPSRVKLSVSDPIQTHVVNF